MAKSNGATFSNRTTPLVEHALHVIDQDAHARLGPMFVQIMRGLADSGLRNSLLTDDEALIDRLEELPIECHLTSRLVGWQSWTLPSELAGRFTNRPDLVQMWGTAGLWGVRRWASRARVPVLIYALGETQVKRLMRGGLTERQCIAVAAERLADPLLACFPMVADRCHTLPLAVATPMGSVWQRKADRTPGVLCAERVTIDNGLNVLVDAVAQVSGAGCDLQVVLAGHGPDDQHVWQHIRHREVQQLVSLIDAPRLWEQALPEIDICVVPACQRELSVAPLLAMGLGKVVIAARDQIAEWFIEDETCWQFTPGSAVELAYLLNRAIEQPERARALGASAAEHVRAHCSVRVLLAKLLALYASLGDTGGALQVAVDADAEGGGDG